MIKQPNTNAKCKEDFAKAHKWFMEVVTDVSRLLEPAQQDYIKPFIKELKKHNMLNNTIRSHFYHMSIERKGGYTWFRDNDNSEMYYYVWNIGLKQSSRHTGIRVIIKKDGNVNRKLVLNGLVNWCNYMMYQDESRRVSAINKKKLDALELTLENCTVMTSKRVEGEVLYYHFNDVVSDISLKHRNFPIDQLQMTHDMAVATAKTWSQFVETHKGK